MGFIPTVHVRTAFRGRVAVGRYRRAISRMAMKFVVQQILDLPSPGVKNFGVGKLGLISSATSLSFVLTRIQESGTTAM